jgi:predicted nucleic acid-binding protein
LEHEDVLKSLEQRIAHGLTLEMVDEFLAELSVLVEPIEVRFPWRPQVRDLSDEVVLEAAINGRAVAGEGFAVLVLRPPELLKMVRR